MIAANGDSFTQEFYLDIKDRISPPLIDNDVNF